jgi:hypothetical protein
LGTVETGDWQLGNLSGRRFAENLRHVLNTIEGHFVSGYADGGDAPDKQIELVPGAVNEAQSFLIDDQETQDRFSRVATLVEGFETPFGLELLSTIHWVVVQERVATHEDVVRRVACTGCASTKRLATAGPSDHERCLTERWSWADRPKRRVAAGAAAL